MLAHIALAATAAVAASGVSTDRIIATLPPSIAADATGRLLVFLEPSTAANAQTDMVDVGADDVFVAGQDVVGFGEAHATIADLQVATASKPIATMPPGSYRMQVVLDRNGDYNYAGRGPGDLFSRVTTVALPLASAPVIPLDHEVPSEAGQFDVNGLPPRAAEQITASRPHLHEEVIPSAALSRFRGTDQAIAAWVLTPPGYDPTSQTTYPTVFTAGGFGATHKLNGQQLSVQWHL